jgi:hypothetical protein
MRSEEKIILGEDHLRSLTSTLLIVEQLLIEIEDHMTRLNKACCLEIENDIKSDVINQNLKVIEEARKQICTLAKKYGIVKRVQSLQRVVDVKKSKIWEILCDARSRKQKGYGKFPKGLVAEFDEDIEELMAITERIKY